MKSKIKKKILKNFRIFSFLIFFFWKTSKLKKKMKKCNEVKWNLVQFGLGFRWDFGRHFGDLVIGRNRCDRFGRRGFLLGESALFAHGGYGRMQRICTAHRLLRQRIAFGRRDRLGVERLSLVRLDGCIFTGRLSRTARSAAQTEIFSHFQIQLNSIKN